MPKIYCPQCGEDLELDSSVRFCRYCGLLLSDTKDSLRGYTRVKRQGSQYVNLSYILLAGLFWIQYFDLISWHIAWGGKFWLVTIFGFIFGLWFMGNWVAERPANYVNISNDETQPEIASGNAGIGLPPARSIPIGDLDRDIGMPSEISSPPSVTENTTKHLTRF